MSQIHSFHTNKDKPSKNLITFMLLRAKVRKLNLAEIVLLNVCCFLSKTFFLHRNQAVAGQNVWAVVGGKFLQSYLQKCEFGCGLIYLPDPDKLNYRLFSTFFFFCELNRLRLQLTA